MVDTLRLIVNADDYGLAPAVSAGIRRAHREGIVTTTTAMMVFPHVERELLMAQEECPNLGLGVHLVATEYTPLRPRTAVQSLLNTKPLFGLRKRGALRALIANKAVFFQPDSCRGDEFDAHFSSIKSIELRDEWRTQIERFLALDIPLDHLDAHHQIAYHNSLVFRVLLELAREYYTPIRLPIGITLQPDGSWTPDTSRLRHSAPLLKQLDVRHPHALIDSFSGEQATVEHLIEIIATLPNSGTFELMCHPAEMDSLLKLRSSYTARRVSELRALTDTRARAAVAVRGIELVPFAALRELERTV